MTDLTGELFGNYRLERQVGHGGFADVYLGRHIYLQTEAAIKVLHVQFAKEALESFLSEARTVIQLDHPHIVRVLECGVEKDQPFLVMSLASGGSLRQRYPLRTRMPLAQVAQYVGQAASALQYAHERKLIHRDIKPENMLLGPNDALLLSDFGLVLQVQSTNAQTMNEVAGTVPYMSPEQLQGKPQAASDQYALGIVAYEWLSGDRPFHGSFVEVASQHVLATPSPLHGQVPGISREIEQVVFTALAKNPQERFPSVQAFANALAEAIAATGNQEEGAPLPAFSPQPPSSPGESLSGSSLSGAFPPSFTLGRKPGPNSTPGLLSGTQSANFKSGLLSATNLLPIDKQPTAEVGVVSQSDILTSMGKGSTHLLSPGDTPLPPGVTSQMTAQYNNSGSFPSGAISTFRNQPFLPGQNTLTAPTQNQKKQRRTVIALVAALVAVALVLLLVLMPVFSSKSGPLFASNAAPGSGSSSLTATSSSDQNGGNAVNIGTNGTPAPGQTPTPGQTVKPGQTPAPGQTPTPGLTPTPRQTASPVFSVTGVNASPSPSSYNGVCTSPLPLTFTGTIQVASGSSGGTVSYNWLRSDGSQIPGQVTFSSGDTQKTVSTTWQGPTSVGSNTLWESLQTTAPNTKTSSQALVQITCVSPLTVTGINVSGTEDLTNCIIAFPLTAVISISANAPAGSLTYTWILSDGTTVGPSTISIAAGQQQATVSYRWVTTGGIRPTYSAMLRVTSPNAIDSNQPVFQTMHC